MIKLGQRLRQSRLEKGLSIEDVMKATKIRPSFLSAIEKGEYNKLPSSSYAQGFVINYAEYLGFSKREALALFRREFDESAVFTVLPERFADPAERVFPRFKVHQTAFGIALAFLLLIGFLGFSYRDAFLNPPLTINTPKSEKIPSGDVIVSGKTSAYATVTIDNTPVSLDDEGGFSKKITLFPGEANIVVQAKNRFGRESTVTKHVIISP
jgi:transcriptional regulator with XRE-family HTH domain